MSLTSQSQVERGKEGITQINLRRRSEDDNQGEEESKKQRPNVIRKGITGTGMDFNKKPVLEEDDYPGEIVWYDVEGADEEFEYPMKPGAKWIINLEKTYKQYLKAKEERERKEGKKVEEEGVVKYGVWLLLMRDAPYCCHCKKEGEHGTRFCPVKYPEVHGPRSDGKPRRIR